MRNRFPHRLNESGLTIIEIIIVVTIMSILFSLVGASYESLKAKVRFAHVVSDFDTIYHAAVNDYTSSPTNDWADNPGAYGAPPSFVGGGAGKSLNKWPTPPCGNWMYSWDNFYGVGTIQAVRITLRKTDLTPIWSRCVQNYGGDCTAPDFFGVPQEFSTVGTKYVYCNE